MVGGYLQSSSHLIQQPVWLFTVKARRIRSCLTGTICSWTLNPFETRIFHSPICRNTVRDEGHRSPRRRTASRERLLADEGSRRRKGLVSDRAFKKAGLTLMSRTATPEFALGKKFYTTCYTGGYSQQILPMLRFAIQNKAAGQKVQVAD